MPKQRASLLHHEMMIQKSVFLANLMQTLKKAEYLKLLDLVQNLKLLNLQYWINTYIKQEISVGLNSNVIKAQEKKFGQKLKMMMK